MQDRLHRFEFRYSSRVDEALAFAAQLHQAQRRKGTQVPYIVHPVHVAWLLQAYGLDEDTVVAGLLHDVLEDTACTREQLCARFGQGVADTVWECSEPDKSLPWEERKGAAIERMRIMSPSARAICCADKAHNLHTMADALERGEQDLWHRFKRGPQAQIDYHRQALAALSENYDHPILEEVKSALERLESHMRGSELTT